jgi:hypothetical protein
MTVDYNFVIYTFSQISVPDIHQLTFGIVSQLAGTGDTASPSTTIPTGMSVNFETAPLKGKSINTDYVLLLNYPTFRKAHHLYCW